jgi:small subunit ribosomal protein S14
MAKKSLIERNKKRERMAKRYAARRAALKAASRDETMPPEERFAARLKLAELPRNSSKVRLRLRCNLTGRPRGNYRKFGLSRIAVRDLALSGQIPGMVKSSW